MNQVINCQVNEQKITEIVERLMDAQPLYEENLNRQEMIEVMKENFTPINVPDLNEISEDELAKRIKSLLSLYLVSGMLSDFTPEEMRMFDEAVKRGN